MVTIIEPTDVAGPSGWSPAIKLDDPTLVSVVAAVNAYVSRLPVVADLPVDDDGEPVGDLSMVKLAACMLAVKTHRRRNSPNGIEQVTGDGVAFVARHDPEITRYLRLDAPAIG